MQQIINNVPATTSAKSALANLTIGRSQCQRVQLQPPPQPKVNTDTSPSPRDQLHWLTYLQFIMPIYRFIHPPIHPSTHPNIHPSIHPSIKPIHTFIHSSIHPPVNLSINLSVRLLVYQFFGLSVYLSLYRIETIRLIER